MSLIRLLAALERVVDSLAKPLACRDGCLYLLTTSGLAFL